MFIYRITNQVNDKMYIGMTNGNNTQYMGSGKLLKQAIDKYGISNFTREILQTCETEEELRVAEAKWIKDTNAVERPDYYNLCEGGRGGHTHNPTTEVMSKQAKTTWDNYTEEERAARLKNNSDNFQHRDKSGANNSKAKKALVNGKEYGCLKEACKDYPDVPYSSLKTIAQKGTYSKFHKLKAEYI